MKLPEILVTVVAFVVGYWLISVFLPLVGRRRGGAGPDVGPQREPTVAGEPAWFEVLEVDEHASAEAIATAYKRRIRPIPSGQGAAPGTGARAPGRTARQADQRGLRNGNAPPLARLATAASASTPGVQGRDSGWRKIGIF